MPHSADQERNGAENRGAGICQREGRRPKHKGQSDVHPSRQFHGQGALYRPQGSVSPSAGCRSAEEGTGGTEEETPRIEPHCLRRNSPHVRTAKDVERGERHVQKHLCEQPCQRRRTAQLRVCRRCEHLQREGRHYPDGDNYRPPRPRGATKAGSGNAQPRRHQPEGA